MNAASSPHFDQPFPHAERRTLSDPPIELIIAQVRFPTLADLFSNEGFVKFASAIRGDFPDASPESQVSFDISADRVSEKSRVPIWRFEDLDKLWTLTLTPDFLALETRQYQSFTAFRDKFCAAWNVLTQNHSIKHRTRLGLRYVDRFADDKQELPDDWMGLLKRELFPFCEQPGTISQSGKYEHRFAIDEAMLLTFRWAFKDRGYSDDDGGEFILDLDAYDPSRQDVNDVAHRLDELKEITHNAFWWVFSDLLERLGGFDDDD